VTERRRQIYAEGIAANRAVKRNLDIEQAAARLAAGEWPVGDGGGAAVHAADSHGRQRCHRRLPLHRNLIPNQAHADLVPSQLGLVLTDIDTILEDTTHSLSDRRDGADRCRVQTRK
jgi:hypothetical protein